MVQTLGLEVRQVEFVGGPQRRLFQRIDVFGRGAEVRHALGVREHAVLVPGTLAQAEKKGIEAAGGQVDIYQYVNSCQKLLSPI